MNLSFEELMNLDLKFDYHSRDLAKSVIENDRKLQKIDCVPTIPDFFDNLSVFITGSTGFMGKVLLEKLLRCCPGIKKIYLLLREKKGMRPEQRVQQMLDCPLFERVKNENSGITSKIEIICGDCQELNLGISESNQNTLKENVDVVFHVAASVRFDDSLKKAVLMNTRGTREMMMLAKQIKHLKVLLHVSTSYTNPDQKVIDEVVYPSAADWRAIIKLVETTDEQVLNILQPKLLDYFPNTYTFSKSLAENIVNEYSENVPVVIFRPSIVISSHSDPVSGWIDNLNGPMGLIVGCGVGIIHSIYGDFDVIADWIQVDIAINAMVISAWYQANSIQNKCLIINACTSNTRPVSYKSLMDNSLKLVKIYPFSRIMWYPFVFMTTNKFLYNIQVLLFHIIPGMILDLLFGLTGEKLSLMRIYRKAYFSNMALQYFMVNEWYFKNGHFMSLQEVMKMEDCEKFSIDFSKHNPIHVMRDCLFGLKKFMLKEDCNFQISIPKSRRKLRRLYILHWTVIVLVLLVLTTILWYRGSVIYNQKIK